MTDQIRGERALAQLADGRSKTTIRQWIENGCPHSLDGTTKIFEESDVVEWCSGRGIDFYDKDKQEPSQLQQQKLRQETHKANELEFKERLREKEYSPVSEFEETQVVLLQQVRLLMIEVVEDVKKKAKLKGKEAEEIDAVLISGFNKIADIDLSE